jgi:tetratricopeptide (TPR) repeat protein
MMGAHPTAGKSRVRPDSLVALAAVSGAVPTDVKLRRARTVGRRSSVGHADTTPTETHLPSSVAHMHSAATPTTAAKRAAAQPLSRRREWLLMLVAVLVLCTGSAGLVAWLNRPGLHNAKPATLAAQAISAGVRAEDRGDFTAAVGDYGRALRYEPRNTQALYDLGVVDYAQGNVGLAADQYRRVLAINARYEPALYNLAIIAQNQNDQALALSLYQRAVRAAPSDPRAHFNLALMLRAMPKYRADGDAQMRIALHLDPSLTDLAARHR